MERNEMLGEVYQSQGKVLLRVCRSVADGEEAAEDLVHSVFLRVLKNGASFENPEHCFRYLRRACKNAALDVFRRAKRRRGIQRKMRDADWYQAVTISEDFEDYELDQRRHAVYAMALPILERICERRDMPIGLFLDIDRGVIVRYAERQGTPVSTVRSRYMAVLQELKKELTKEIHKKGWEIEFSDGKT